MRKLRLYLDTSVIGDLDAPENSDRGMITKEFFRIVATTPNEYELFISPTGMGEINAAPVEKRQILLALLRSLNYIALPENREAHNLARLYVEEGVLPARHIKDLTHIAYAVCARCDYILSWNMKHFVRIQTISRVNAVNAIYRYPNVIIATPVIITGERRDEND